MNDAGQEAGAGGPPYARPSAGIAGVPPASSKFAFLISPKGGMVEAGREAMWPMGRMGPMCGRDGRDPRSGR